MCFELRCLPAEFACGAESEQANCSAGCAHPGPRPGRGLRSNSRRPPPVVRKSVTAPTPRGGPPRRDARRPHRRVPSLRCARPRRGVPSSPSCASPVGASRRRRTDAGLCTGGALCAAKAAPWGSGLVPPRGHRYAHTRALQGMIPRRRRPLAASVPSAKGAPREPPPTDRPRPRNPPSPCTAALALTERPTPCPSAPPSSLP